MSSQRAIRFLLDMNVPVSVGRVPSEAGHDTIRVVDIMPADSPDPIVATAAMEAGRILVSWDRDFNHQRFGKPRFKSLRRIGFSCPEPMEAKRLADVIDILQFVCRRGARPPKEVRISMDKFMIREPNGKPPRGPGPFPGLRP